jgi:hypothetical protein
LQRWTVWRRKSWPADLLPEATDRGVDLGFALVDPVMVRSEPAMLAAIIRNLLENALRFTPRGGTIDVGVYREDGRVILQVEDTGPGIASTDMDQIFEPFFRGSRPEGEGTDLGLSIVKRIVDSLGGKIALENIEGVGRSGLRATVRLPIVEVADSLPSKSSEGGEPGDGAEQLIRSQTCPGEQPQADLAGQPPENAVGLAGTKFVIRWGACSDDGPVTSS